MFFFFNSSGMCVLKTMTLCCCFCFVLFFLIYFGIILLIHNMQNALKLVASAYKWYILVPFSALCVVEVYDNGIWKVELGMTNALIRDMFLVQQYISIIIVFTGSAFCRQKLDSAIVIIYSPNLPMNSFQNNP